jgi:ketosteroid isomerase-like protein
MLTLDPSALATHAFARAVSSLLVAALTTATACAQVAPREGSRAPMSRAKSLAAATAAAIAANEDAFSRTAAEKGVRGAFLEFIADDGVLFRPRPLPGKTFLQASPSSPGLLQWGATFADASASGDMGYDLGPWETRRAAGDSVRGTGTFSTVWIRQPDGAFRFMFDVGITHRPMVRGPLTYGPLALGEASSATNAAAGANVRGSASVLRADSAFAATATRDGIPRAYQSHGAPELHVLRNGHHPLAGIAAARDSLPAWSDLTRGTLVISAIAAGVARAGDLAYSYGTYERRDPAANGALLEQGNYMRVWRRVGGAWKIAHDVADPVAK